MRSSGKLSRLSFDYIQSGKACKLSSVFNHFKAIHFAYNLNSNQLADSFDGGNSLDSTFKIMVDESEFLQLRFLMLYHITETKNVFFL